MATTNLGVSIDTAFVCAVLMQHRMRLIDPCATDAELNLLAEAVTHELDSDRLIEASTNNGGDDQQTRQMAAAIELRQMLSEHGVLEAV